MKLIVMRDAGTLSVYTQSDEDFKSDERSRRHRLCVQTGDAREEVPHWGPAETTPGIQGDFRYAFDIEDPDLKCEAESPEKDCCSCPLEDYVSPTAEGTPDITQQLITTLYTQASADLMEIYSKALGMLVTQSRG